MTKIKTAVFVTTMALAWAVPQAAGASTTTVKSPVALVCYSIDPVILATAVGNYQPGAPTRIPCEAGVPAPGQGAVLRYQINGPGVQWDTSSGAPYNGATLVLNTWGTKIWMPYRIIDGHVYCPVEAFLAKWKIGCDKAFYGSAKLRGEDGNP